MLVGGLVLTPGQTTSAGPHVTTTDFGGTARTVKPLGTSPLLGLSSAARVSAGPRASFFFALKRYQASDDLPFTSAC